MIEGLQALGVGLLGIVLGVVAAAMFRASERSAARTPEVDRPELDEQVAAVLAVLPSATVVLRRDHSVVRAGASAHAFGLVRGDLVAPAAVTELVDAVVRDGETRDADLEVPRGPFGGGTLMLHVRVAALGDRHVLLLADDRTEARRVEATRRDFAVNVSHELKTPVGALSLLAETVEDAADDPETVRRFAGRMQTEAARLSALVQEIIELSRLQVPDPLGVASPVDVDRVVQEAVDRARTPAAAKGIEIEVGRESGATVWGDHDLLVTAIRNLLDNAVAYSDSRTRVAVGTALKAAAGIVEIAVVDHGIGIPVDEQPRLFERFYRVDPARSRETGGTGLGLSIVKHVAADHGGEVTVWSQPGKGSTFTLRLPVIRTPLSAGPTPSEGVAR
ncbi:sensor histidine kinase [Actinotalea sp.]|uniref:sensor histidine kinase n=1 Tax=Actinotalea sp. TaxID=1872145 RepID=UPI0035690ACA